MLRVAAVDLKRDCQPLTRWFSPLQGVHVHLCVRAAFLSSRTRACYEMGGCQNYGPFLGTPNIRCRIIIGTQRGTISLTTTQISLVSVFWVLSRSVTVSWGGTFPLQVVRLCKPLQTPDMHCTFLCRRLVQVPCASLTALGPKTAGFAKADANRIDERLHRKLEIPFSASAGLQACRVTSPCVWCMHACMDLLIGDGCAKIKSMGLCPRFRFIQVLLFGDLGMGCRNLFLEISMISGCLRVRYPKLMSRCWS